MDRSQVEIVEVSPRDGLQNEAVILSSKQKVALIKQAVAAGARRVEAVSFVRPDAVPQLADAEAVMAAVPRRVGVSYIGLVLNRRGLDRAVAAEVDEVNVVIAASDAFNRRNQNAGTDALVSMVNDVLGEASSAGLATTVTIATAFGCPFEGIVTPDAVGRLIEQVVESGPDELALADTIGVAVPSQVRELVQMTHSLTTSPLRLHLHNTRNTGYANAVAGLDAGVRVLDSSIGGFGGCPFAPRATGNIATEDLVYLLEHSGLATGLDLDALIDAAGTLGEALQKQVPSMLSRAGDFPAAPE